MVTEERLELTSAVEAEHHDRLDDLADKLEDVDDTLRHAGSDVDDKLTIDVEVKGIESALTQLEALDSRLDSIDDKISFDGLDGSTIPEPDSPSTSEGGNAGGVAMTSGGIPRYDEIDPDAFTPAGVEIGGFSTPNAASDERMGELLDFLDGNNNDSIFDSIKDQTSDFLDSLDGAGDEFKELRFTMSNFYDIFAALIPILGVFVGAIPAAVTGIVALGGAAIAAAVALGGIGALGAMGMSLQRSGDVSFGALNEQLGEVRKAFVDSFAPLARSFAPLIRSSLTRLETLMGPLATAADGLRMFTDEFAAMSEGIATMLPSLIDLTLQFSHAVIPVLSGLASYILQKDIFGLWLTSWQSHFLRCGY